MLQVRVAQLCGSELDGLTVSQLEDLERMQSEALRRCGVAKYVRLRQEFQEKEEHMREDVEKMRREFEERMEKMKTEVQKIQEEKVHLMGLEQRLRQEFQTQVQAEQMSNEVSFRISYPLGRSRTRKLGFMCPSRGDFSHGFRHPSRYETRD